MNAYVILSNTGSIGTGKKLRVIEESYQHEPQRRTSERDTLTGKLVQSLGVHGYAVSFTALVHRSSPPTGYASYADVEAWFAANTISGASFKFQDVYGTVTDVALIGNFKPVRAHALYALDDALQEFFIEFKVVKRA